MRKTLIAALAAVLGLSGIAWAANQVGTDTFRKVLAVELFSSNAAVGVSGSPIVAGLEARASGGCTPYHLSGGTAASTNSTSIKAATGTLCDLTLINTTITIYYIKLYDSASAPTCSSATNLKHVYPIVPAAASGGAGGIQRSIPIGEAYANGIGFCVTASGGDTSNDNAATGVYVEASFK